MTTTNAHTPSGAASDRLHPGLLILSPADNVGVAIGDVDSPTGPVPRGHKVATRAVRSGEPVLKYGQVIGFASIDIAPGDHVHSHNLRFGHFSREGGVDEGLVAADVLPVAQQATFEGYVRSDGRVGTRNYLGILTSVNCSATAARQIAERFRYSGLLEQFPNIDGVVPLAHGTGCGIGDPETLAVLRRTMAGYLMHPNFGGFLVLGLGCEHNQIAELTRNVPVRPDLPIVATTIQELGGTRRTVEAGVATLTSMLPEVDKARRSTVPASELVLGTNCGGSDAYSGITANPAVGSAVDRLVRNGGTGVVAETPEVYGAEHLLTRRAVAPAVAEKLLARIGWWEEYLAKSGGTLDNNPTPGNKAGGLTTILEKSLGTISKGGTTPLADVVDYAEQVTSKGFVFMDTPGYDPVSVTGIVAGGAQVMVFTTGRGSAFGCKPVPSIKVATNSELYRRMTDDMDVNAGAIVDGDRSLDEVGQEIFDLVLETASGRATKSEDLGYGDEEFVPWRVGAVI
ncbi:UxaA family hydrolase [Blastococcus sp. VKM Ac-2987]|uniref:UxaA family hydrolase n=1 Tax=Blastococcus sp. VKM Ac-2987 TaxID=3004141 RepID=UPI0022ABC3AC|nr:altronate dehydratase family protein [Blastococcus sp. VKM Ac-2987]MCZ2856924.1 altronate dehydratase family protein [Blastococcus sp. VKM Ac-2987]